MPEVDLRGREPTPALIQDAIREIQNFDVAYALDGESRDGLSFMRSLQRLGPLEAAVAIEQYQLLLDMYRERSDIQALESQRELIARDEILHAESVALRAWLQWPMQMFLRDMLLPGRVEH